MRYSAGMLDNALGVAVACHVEHCHQCQQQIQVFENFGGELIEESDDATLPSDLLGKVLAQLDTPEQPTPPLARHAGVPRALQRALPNGIEGVKWRGMTRAIKECTLSFGDSGLQAKLYKIAAGKQLPEHTHKGQEYTVVLKGSFSDSAGHYRQGDFIRADTQVIHQPRASDDQDCICFAVLDAPLKFSGLLGAFINPFMR